MKEIKFSSDYEKLPVNWENSKATLIAVYPEKTYTIKTELYNFWVYDTKIRNQDKFFPLKFEDALILVFIHESGKPFTTIRRNYKEKSDYYIDSIGEKFKLVMVK